MNSVASEVVPEVRLDIGCGLNKKPGFIGVDLIQFEGVDVAFDLRKAPWPWPDNSVTEVHCSHFLEHLTNHGDKWERIVFFNELNRILKQGAKATLVFPHWASNRYYGDPTHKEPFSEMGFYYLSREWRISQAPHSDIKFNPNGYDCDFEATWAYNIHQDLLTRNQQYQMHAITFWKEAAQDIIATLTKR